MTLHSARLKMRPAVALAIVLAMVAIAVPMATAGAAGPTRPIGHLDRITVSGGQMTIEGWTLDRDGTASIRARVYVNGAYVTGGVADRSRPDVTRAYPGFTKTGFSFRVPERDGEICVYGINDGNGGHTKLGCRYNGDRPAPAPRATPTTPRGRLEVGGPFAEKVIVRGWAVDADRAGQPISVRFYSGSKYISGLRADQPRADVDRAVSGAGPRHGFLTILDIDAKVTQSVCAYAINDNGAHARIGCFYQTSPGKWTNRPPNNFAPLPAGSGSGRRVVYSNSRQRVWLVESDGYVVDSYPVSGRYNTPRRGTYSVFSKSRVAYAGHDGITMRNMVRFARGSRLAIGFHAIPRYASGRPLQSESALGSYRSAGCVRQADRNAARLYDWAGIGTKVVVI